MALTRRNIKNIFIYAFAKLGSYGLNFFTLPILTRLLTPKDFGIIALAWAFPTIGVSLFTCGLSPAAQRFYFEYRNDKRKLDALIFSSQLFLYISLFTSSFVVFGFKNHISRLILGNNTYGMAIFVTFISAYFGQIIHFYLVLYQNMERATVYSIFTILQALITAMLSLLFVWYFKMSFMGPLYASLAGSFVVCLTLLFRFNMHQKVIFNSRILFENMKYGLQLMPKSFTGFINRFFDKYMLNNMLSLSAVGVYNIGQSVGEATYMLMNTVWTSFQPACYREVFDKGKGGSADVGRMFTIFCYITLVPVVVLILFAQEIVYFIAPPTYYKAIDIIIIILGGIATQVFGMYIGVQYAYRKKAYLIFPITVIGTVANVAANILLVPRFGLIGAGISTVITYFTINSILTFIGQKLYRILYEWKIIISLFSYIIFLMSSILYLRTINISIVHFYLIKTIFLFVFFLIGIKARIITGNSIRAFFTLFSSRETEIDAGLSDI